MCESDLCDTKSALLERIKALEDKVASLCANGASLANTKQEIKNDDFVAPPFDVDETHQPKAKQTIEPEKEETKETVNQPPKSVSPISSDGDVIQKITSQWSEVINRSIKDGSLTVYFAINDTKAFADGKTLIIKSRDEEGRNKVVTNKEKIQEYLLKLYNALVDIKTQVAELAVKTLPKDDVFDKFDDLSKKFPQNFSKGEI